MAEKLHEEVRLDAAEKLAEIVLEVGQKAQRESLEKKGRADKVSERETKK